MRCPKLRLLLLTVPVEQGGTPIRNSARASPNETSGQKSQDWVPEPGGGGHHVPNFCVMRISTGDRARTSQRRVAYGWRSRHRWDRSLRWGTVTAVEDHVFAERKGRNEHLVQWACQTRLQERWNTENMRLRARQKCPAWSWTNSKNDTPIEEPKQRKEPWADG